MNMAGWISLGIIVVIAAIALVYYNQRRRSQHLRRRFGMEYARAVTALGRRKAESELEHRARRVERFHIHGISQEEKQHFEESWKTVQAAFVDGPEQAVVEAHRLVDALMHACGYPVSDEFRENADDLSVDHPDVVEHYRAACLIADRRENSQATTEEMRTAMVHYRALFEALLRWSAKTPEIVTR